jgi:hypothetical protein
MSAATVLPIGAACHGYQLRSQLVVRYDHPSETPEMLPRTMATLALLAATSTAVADDVTPQAMMECAMVADTCHQTLRAIESSRRSFANFATLSTKDIEARNAAWELGTYYAAHVVDFVIALERAGDPAADKCRTACMERVRPALRRLNDASRIAEAMRTD